MILKSFEDLSRICRAQMTCPNGSHAAIIRSFHVPEALCTRTIERTMPLSGHGEHRAGLWPENG